MAESERLFDFGFPVNDVSDDLVLAVEVATLSDFLDGWMEFFLSEFLSIDIWAYAVNHDH